MQAALAAPLGRGGRRARPGARSQQPSFMSTGGADPVTIAANVAAAAAILTRTGTGRETPPGLLVHQMSGGSSMSEASKRRLTRVFGDDVEALAGATLFPLPLSLSLSLSLSVSLSLSLSLTLSLTLSLSLSLSLSLRGPDPRDHSPREGGRGGRGRRGRRGPGSL